MATFRRGSNRSNGENGSEASANDPDAQKSIRPARTRQRKGSARRAVPATRDPNSLINFVRHAPVRSDERDRQVPPEHRESPNQKANEPKANGFDKPDTGKRRTITGVLAVDRQTMPAEINERYIQDGRRYYFPSGDPAFVDHGDKVTTRSENTVIIHDFSAIAKARQWNRVEVGGTEPFKREAWRAAKLAGLEVVGYKPTAVEQAQLIRVIAQRLAGESSLASDRPADPFRRTIPPLAKERDGLADPSRPGSERLLVGALVDHGRDHYQFKPRGEISYFVKVETPRGVRTRWGIDLARAVEKSLSGVRKGDIVGVRQLGKEPVTVIEKERDAEGRVIREHAVEAHRNRWSVETTEFLKQRQAMARVMRDQSISTQDAVRQHPRLKGTYIHLQFAEALAKERLHPDSQREFLSRIRNELAHTVERGEVLSQAMPLRQQPRHLAQLRERNATHVR